VNVVVREVLGSIEKTHDKLALNPKFNCDECGYRALPCQGNLSK
jgi:hypothetical protein